MKLLGSITVVSLVLLALFAALNWGLFISPTTLSFGTFALDAPLGLILLGFALAYALIFMCYAAMQRTAMFMESRRHAQELRTQREIADKLEASRIHELRLQLERETALLRTHLEETVNGLAASIGQIDDKLNRLLPPSARGLPPSA